MTTSQVKELSIDDITVVLGDLMSQVAHLKIRMRVVESYLVKDSGSTTISKDDLLLAAERRTND